MLRKSLITAAVALLLTPALATAGMVTVSVATGSSSGTATPAGTVYRTAALPITITAGAGMTLDKVMKNGVNVTSSLVGTGPYTYTVPLSAISQTVYAYFKVASTSYPTSLTAKLPATLTGTAGTPFVVSGQQSIVKYMPPNTYARFYFSGAGYTFSPYSGNVINTNYIITNASATGAGAGTITLTLTGNGQTSTATTAATVNAYNYGRTGSTECLQCHAGWTPAVEYAAQTAGHAVNTHGPTCSDCHAMTTQAPHPGAPQCATCHAKDSAYGRLAALRPYSLATCGGCHSSTNIHTEEPFPAGYTATSASPCSNCHGTDNMHNLLDADGTKTSPRKKGCVDCHAAAVAANHTGTLNDNNGVRAIVPEFSKRSHHILSTGGTLHNEQCVVCHLEGKRATYGFNNLSSQIVIDSTYHMKDAAVYLRDADTDAAYKWSGTEHTNMDNFCFSCHDSNGATSAGIAAIMAGKNYGGAFSAANPFADTLTNSYDLVARAGVVDVKSAFNTTNASHHAVSGQRYKYRFSTVANATAWATRNSQAMPAAGQIAVGNTDLDGEAIDFIEGEDSYDPAGAEKGGHATLFEADKFVYAYTPLGATESVADNSTLHCGDCHTVGQWTAGSTTNAAGVATTDVIGAHASNNDYLLRNSLGTDALHSGQTYVCFLCHKGNDVVTANDALWDALVAEGEISSTKVKPTWNAGWNRTHPNVIAGQVESGYASAHAVSAFHAQCQADSSYWTGNSNSALSRVAGTFGGGHKDRTLDFTPAPNATAALPTASGEGGNVSGIACTNCHNSGLRQGWGGIHGGNNTYTDGLGRVQKTYRFMPGMGNYRYAPPGGWDGKDTSDASLQTVEGAGVGAGKPMGGCYTNNSATESVGWSSCAHHGTSTTTSPGRGPGTDQPTMRASYGGGTAATPTAAEPTVREATAGGTLVTRPLKY